MNQFNFDNAGIMFIFGSFCGLFVFYVLFNGLVLVKKLCKDKQNKFAQYLYRKI